MRVLFYILISLIGVGLSLVIIAPSLFDTQSYKTKIEKLVFEKTGKYLQIKGKVSLSFFPTVQIGLEEINFEQDKDNKLFKSSKLVISPDIISLIRGDLTFNSIKLNKPNIYLKKNKNGAYNWESVFNHENNKNINDGNNNKAEKTEDKMQSKRNTNPLNIKYLSIKEAKVFYDNNKKQYNVDKINLILVYKKNNDYDFKGDLNYNNEKFEFDYSIKNEGDNTNIKGLLTNNKIFLKNDTIINLRNFSGKGKVAFKLENIKDYFKAINLENVLLNIDTDISFSKEDIKFSNIKLKTNDALLSGFAKYKKEKNLKFIKVDLKSNKLDLDKFIPNSFKKESDNKEVIKEKNKKNNIKNKQIIDEVFHILDGFKLDVTLFSDEILYKDFKSDYVNLNLKKNKDIKLALSSKNLLEGTLKSSIFLKKNRNTTINVNLKDIDIEKLNNLKNYNYFSGFMSLDINLSSNLKNKDYFIKNSTGNGNILLKKITVKNLNLNELRSTILSVNSISDLNELRKKVFEGNTKINDQEINIQIDNGNIIIPNTSVKINKDNLALKGEYSIYKDTLNLDLNHDSNDFLSLFTININGNLENIKTNLNYNEDKVENIISDIVNKKLEKKVKDKLDKKFNNIINNLLD